jgi:hypothetical protein
MTLIQISERVGNFLQLATALPFGVVGLALAVHVVGLLT